MHQEKTKEAPKRVFAFNKEFPNEVEVALKAYDHVFQELTAIGTGKMEFPDEYGVCNNLYKFRYIMPNDIATFTSNLIKVLQHEMICPTVTDVEKFAVVSAKQFVEEHGCVPIEHSSIYGLYRYTTDQISLQDLLVLCENDFYHQTVVSRFEMQERAKLIKKDCQKFADMHFSANIMKIISALPNLMTQTAFNEMSYIEQKVVQTYIENFILFVIMFNTIVMSNMIFFCVPKSTYNTKLMVTKPRYDTNNLLSDNDIDEDNETEDVVSESVKMDSKVKPIYIVLFEGQQWISDQIKKATRSRFSHVGISFDITMSKIYSYSMGAQTYDNENVNKNGFRFDNLTLKENHNTPFTVYTGLVSSDDFNKMKTFANKYVGNKDTKYSIGLILRQLWKDDKIHKNDEKKSNEQICSTFVNAVLQSAELTVTDKNKPSPADFERSLMTNMSQFGRVFSGTYQQYDEDEVWYRVNRFAEGKNTKLLEKQVVTECCLLKTNTMRCNSKIPFDINMRNMVLQDTHPTFKDTIAAIDYITTDTRSPIAQLLYRYGHPSTVLNNEDGLMICKMFMNDPICQCPIYDEYQNLLSSTKFCTDMSWLDRIAYGNNFVDGNYRTDAMGNEHRHPIQQTLDMVYRMFAECKLKTKEELCNHILKIANIMKGIAKTYSEWGIYNRELVRDILAVFGEIMTRSMIKLYNSHMTIIASDNMDDVDAPGYMYTESFYDYIMEEDNNNASQTKTNTTTSTNASSTQNTNNGKANVTIQDTSDGKKAKAFLQKARHFLSKIVNGFITWVQNVLSKAGFKFAENHKQEIDYVTKNTTMNQEITQAIQNGQFKPTIENWPVYNIPLEKIVKNKLSDIVKAWIAEPRDANHQGNPTIIGIKKEFYPVEIRDKIVEEKKAQTKTEFAEMMLRDKISEYILENETSPTTVPSNSTNQSTNKIVADKTNNENESANVKLIKNFFLFGTADQPKPATELTANLWNDLINNITNTEKALNIFLKFVVEDNNQAMKLIKPKVDELQKQIDQQNATNTASDRELETKFQFYNTILSAVTSISNEYQSAFVNCMQTNFYRVSYKLYRDVISAYKQTKGSFQQQQPTTPQQQTAPPVTSQSNPPAGGNMIN